MVTVYLCDSGWAYKGVYQTIGAIPSISDQSQKLWTMLGALLLELSESGYKHVVVYNDTDLVHEWCGVKKIENKRIAKIANEIKLKERHKFLSVNLLAMDTYSLHKGIESLKLK